MVMDAALIQPNSGQLTYADRVPSCFGCFAMIFNCVEGGANELAFGQENA